MELETKAIIDRLINLKKQGILDKDDLFEYESEVVFDKDSQQSEIMRQKGNKLFAKKIHNSRIHEGILMLYTRSIALAFNNPEQLAAAYANRSALLLHLHKLNECLIDIGRALKITKSSSLKVKLFCRQSECYALLHEDKARNSLTKAKHWLTKVESDSDIEKLNKTISKTDLIIENNDPNYKKKIRPCKIPYDSDCVDIQYNQTYGNHVVATKDIQPGEFVYEEKFYAASVNSSKNYICCSHCLAISWTLIPCDHCSLYLFCSEKCKSEAWERYHDVECLLKLPDDSSNLIHHCLRLSTKSLIMGIKEAGNLKKFKDLVSKVYQSKDNKHRGFPLKNKSANYSFEYLISLTPSKCEENLCSCVDEVTSTLVQLIVNTHILAINFEISQDLKNLMHNEDLIFIGSVLLRVMLICCINASNTLHYIEGCQGKEKYGSCLYEFCCSRGMYISPFTRIIHHNCNNNVDKICTNDGRVLYYALQPISKNDQITVSYCTNFTTNERAGRQLELTEVFEFHCNCIACKEDWPTVDAMLASRPLMKNLKEIEFHFFTDKFEILMKAIDKPNYKPSKKTIKSLAEDIKILFKKICRQPNVIADCFTHVLSLLIPSRYCIKISVPDECKSIMK